MFANDEVYLLKFFLPSPLARLPMKERAGTIKSYFYSCMGQVQPFLADIKVMSKQEYLLSAALQGPEASYANLKRHLAITNLGELIPEQGLKIVAASKPHGA